MKDQKKLQEGAVKERKPCGIKRFLPTKRRLIQLYASLLFNANLKGFQTGRIYQGPFKNICTPGLNCYSCPGASGSCPLGALQNALTDSSARTPYYIFGIIMLYGLLFGRWICGFLCPFGLIQDLLYHIKTPKLKKSRITRVFSYFKYVILVFLVLIVPLLYASKRFPLPAFCKYICPSGTLLGAVGLLSHPENANKLGMLGPLFTWKFLLLVLFVAGAVFIYRFFCRFFCPLGAIYGLFNKISFLGVQLDRKSCVDCGKCHATCKMDIHRVGDHECISCGACVDVCPTKAISWKGGKVFLDPNVSAIPANASEDEAAEITARNAKIKKRNKIVRIVSAVLALALLVGALFYYNVIDQVPDTVGYEVGDVCPVMDVTVCTADGNSTYNISKQFKKATVINFWGTWCSPCVAELPHFEAVAQEYGSDIAVLALHSDYGKNTALDFMEAHYPNRAMFCALDVDDAYYNALGGDGTYPMTVVLDENNVIVARFIGSLTHEQLKAAIELALGK